MSDINKVFVVGRLTRDFEIKYTGSGTACGKTSIACNRRVKKGDKWADEPNFFEITLWGKIAESLKAYLTKGKQVAIDGELKFSKWEQGGMQKSRVEIVCNNIQLLGGGQKGQNPKAESIQSSSNYTGFEDDIPF